MNEIVNKNKAYSFYLSKVKQEIREELSGLLQRFKGNKKVMTLGGIYAKDAKMFASQNATVFSIERNKDVFEKQKQEVKHYPIVTILGNVEDIIDDSIISGIDFDLVYLDYLGPYTSSKEKTIISLIKNNTLSKDGYLCLTLELAREKESFFSGTVIKDITCGGNISEYYESRSSILEQGIKDLGVEYGVKFKTVMCKEYKNTDSEGEVIKKAVPMLLLVYKLIS